MNLSSSQFLVLASIQNNFPTPCREGDEQKIRPRSKHQPPTRNAILEALKIEPALLDDTIEFLMAHDLVRKVYRYGTSEFSEIHVAPGQVLRAPVAIDRTKDADPSDTRYGLYCFQITERGIAALKAAKPQQLGSSIVVFSS